MRIPIPREHGTWAMMYAPLLCAVFSVGRIDVSFVLFLVSVTFAFFLRDPLEAWIRLRKAPAPDPDRIGGLRSWVVIYAILATAPALILIFAMHRILLAAFGALFVVMLGLHIKWQSERTDRRMPSELAAVVALTSSAPACRYAMTGTFDSISVLLWILNALFFSSSVFYLKMRVSRYAKKSTARIFTGLCVLYHAALVVILSILWSRGLLSWFVLPAFAPVVVRAFQGILIRGKLNLMRIGLAEVAYTISFVLFMAMVF